LVKIFSCFCKFLKEFCLTKPRQASNTVLRF
jgi:hypothetical protein